MNLELYDLSQVETSLKSKELKSIERPNMDETFLEMARSLAKRSSCLRRGYGAVAVDPEDNSVISSGYNGGYRKGINCCDRGYCIREELDIPHGERYELCESIHSEMNVCLQAKAKDLKGAIVYLYGLDKKTGLPVKEINPCKMCDRVLRNVLVSEIRCWEKGKIVRKSLHTDVYMCGRNGT